MLIKTLAPLVVKEGWMKQPLVIAADEFAEVADEVGEMALQQGAARVATLAEARAACPTYKPLEDVEALLDLAAGKGAVSAPLPLIPKVEAAPGAWVPTTEVAEAVAKHKGKAGKKSN